LFFINLTLASWSQITEDGLIEFAFKLDSKLAGLQSLSLGIENWKHITNQSISILSAKITQNLVNLQKLSLWLNNGSAVTSTEKEDLKKQFERIEDTKIEYKYLVISKYAG